LALDDYASILEILRNDPWFGGLPAELQVLILHRSIMLEYSKGDVIISEGTPAQGMFAVLEGQVRVMRGVGDAHDVLIHVGEVGFWFGDHGTMTGMPSIGSIVADSPVRVLLLPVSEFERIVEGEPRHFRAFAGLLFERYALLFRYMGEMHGLAAEEWLHTRLADLAAMRRGNSPTNDPVSITMSQADLASMIGLSRQTLNALLTRLEAHGLIEVGYRSVRVLDEARLRNVRGRDDEKTAGEGVADPTLPRSL
jgi:CRP/FNR family transcriptional regulator, cyclic AMP receptor protein